jgi:protein-L-isoaspartate(D-aspartate) O-methyltransferase
MTDYEKARLKMVKNQLAARGIRDQRVLEAMSEIPRHEFVPPALEHEAYDDNPLPIGEGQTISQPYIVALMTQMMGLEGGEKVLEIGSGSGYQCAILCKMAARVYTVERSPSLVRRAERILTDLGFENFLMKEGDGSEGWMEYAPFDAIMVTAGSPKIPETLIEQLTDRGRMVIPVGNRYSQVLKRITKVGDTLKEEEGAGCRFVDLIGAHGWAE